MGEKLTAAQREALDDLKDYLWVSTANRSLQAVYRHLTRKGFTKYLPDVPGWRITRAGRAALKEQDKSRP